MGNPCDDFVPPLPPGLEKLLQDISTQVLNRKPQNIYCFVADYLDEKLGRGAGSSAPKAKGVGDGTGKSDDPNDPESLRRRLSGLQELVKSSVEVGTKFAEKYRRAGELQLLPEGCQQDTDENRLDQQINVLTNLLSNMEMVAEGQGEVKCTGEGVQGSSEPNADLLNLSTKSLDKLICQEVQALLTQVRNMSAALEHAQAIAAALERLGVRRDQLSGCNGAKTDQESLTQEQEVKEGQQAKVKGQEDAVKRCQPQPMSGIPLQPTQENHAFDTVTPGSDTVTGSPQVVAEGQADLEFPPPPDEAALDQMATGTCVGELMRRDQPKDGQNPEVVWPLCDDKPGGQEEQLDKVAEAAEPCVEAAVAAETEGQGGCGEVTAEGEATGEVAPTGEVTTEVAATGEVTAEVAETGEVTGECVDTTGEANCAEGEEGLLEKTAEGTEPCVDAAVTAETEGQGGCGEVAETGEVTAEVAATGEATGEVAATGEATGEVAATGEATGEVAATGEGEATGEVEATGEATGEVAATGEATGECADTTGEDSGEAKCAEGDEGMLEKTREGAEGAESSETSEIESSSGNETVAAGETEGGEQTEIVPTEGAAQDSVEPSSSDGGAEATTLEGAAEGTSPEGADQAGLAATQGADGGAEALNSPDAAGNTADNSDSQQQPGDSPEILTVSEASAQDATFFAEQFGTLREVLSGQRSVSDCGLEFLLFGTGLLVLVGYGAVKGIGRISALLSNSAPPTPVSLPPPGFYGISKPPLMLPSPPSCYTPPSCLSSARY